MMTTATSMTAVKTLASTESVRTFATNKKRLMRRQKRLRALKNPVEKKKPVEADAQHVDWVDFQNAISIDGFDTGQTTYVSSNIGQRHRGGVKYRAYLERKEAKMRPEKIEEIGSPKNGQYPALRYSPEETQRLLDEAYAGIPKKTGKRGTKNLQRQSNRWHLDRKERKKYKRDSGVRTHERRMVKRSRVVREVKEVKVEAPAIREKTAAYQKYVMEQWTEIMFGDIAKQMTPTEYGQKE